MIPKKLLLLGILACLTLQADTPPTTMDSQAKATKAEWSWLVYIQADNSLADFAAYNMNDMQVGMKQNSSVNVLVQWDKPGDRNIERYQMGPGSKTLVGSINTEMSHDPGTGLVNAMQWIQNTYPANRYGIILWNHGSGIEDLRSMLTKQLSASDYAKNAVLKDHQILTSWLQIPGLSGLQERGILYNDTTGSCLTNPALLSAVTTIHQNLGQKIDILGMDACLMAMLEVAYQIKDHVSVFVGSQQTEPGYGWSYSGFLTPLTNTPTMTAAQVAKSIVSSYGAFYKKAKQEQDYTQSAYDLTKTDALKANMDAFISQVNSASTVESATTKKIIKTALNAAIQMYMSEYIDLYSFYSSVLNQINRGKPKSGRILNAVGKKPKQFSTAYTKAVKPLKQTITNGLQLITQMVIANIAGPQLATVKGISIYFPAQGAIDASYPNTMFAKNTAWIQFIKKYR